MYLYISYIQKDMAMQRDSDICMHRKINMYIINPTCNKHVNSLHDTKNIPKHLSQTLPLGFPNISRESQSFTVWLKVNLSAVGRQIR